MKNRTIRAEILILLCGPLWAQSVTPANPIVQAGQTLQLAADRTVTWSLLPGSAGTIDSTGLYRAPSSIRAPHVMGGCQIGPPDSIFNTRIDSLPLHPNNTAWMAALPPQNIGLSPTWGTNVADNSTPSQNFVFLYTDSYNSQVFQLPDWPNLKRESGIFSDPQTNVDRHVLTVNHQTCQVYEIYNNYPATVSPPYTAQSGWQYRAMSYALPTAGATDASGMPLAPTTLTLDDIRSGVIRHAMRVTFGNAYIAPSFLWPATSNAGAYGVVPYGSRFRLKASVDISSVSPTAQIILRALREYGMIISDGGGNWDIIASTDLTEDRAVQAAILEIQGRGDLVNSSSFEIVDESPLMVSPGSSQIAYNNGYVTPPAFAIAQADDGTHTPVRIPIALEGIGLNAPEGGGVWIQSGVVKKLSVLTGNFPNTAVTWAMAPALGTLDPVTGMYAAPSVSAPTTTSITAISIADPNVSVTFPVTVMPAGVIRIMSGDTTSNPAAPKALAPDFGPDSEGNIWWRDQAAERGWGVKNDYWYGPNYGSPFQWPPATDIYRYQTQYYNTADTVYRFSVPNGNYSIDYYVAVGCSDTDINKIDPVFFREHLEAQGQIAAHDFRPQASVGGRCTTPIHTAIPAQVTDNNLYFALRRITDHTQKAAYQNAVTIISSFSVTPVQDSPHLTIDPATPPAVTVSQSLQLYSVGWFMSNSVNWTLVSGPGSLSATGLYTAPSTPVTGTVIVRATSTVDPSQTAIVQVHVVFGAITLSPGSVTLNRSGAQVISASIGSQPYSNVIWSISPLVGRVNAHGLYTAPDTLAQDTTVTIMATSIDDLTQTGTTTVTVRATAPTIRINCSDGGGFTDAQGNVWATDYGYSAHTVAYNSPVPIARTTPDLYLLYDSSRYVYAGQGFEYNFSLPNGEYMVTLKFADYSFDTPGEYNFNVQINGAPVLTNFDPDAVYGAGKTAVDRTFVTYVSTKNLQISFFANKGAAFINGIEILPTSASSRAISGKTMIRGRTR